MASTGLSALLVVHVSTSLGSSSDAGIFLAPLSSDIPLPAMLWTGSLVSVVSLVAMILGYRIILPLVF